MSITEKIKDFLKTDRGKEFEIEKKEAEEFLQFSQTEAGKSIKKRFSKQVYLLLNELFQEYEKPNMNNLLSIIARLEERVQLLTLFVRAESKKDKMEKILIEAVSDD